EHRCVREALRTRWAAGDSDRKRTELRWCLGLTVNDSTPRSRHASHVRVRARWGAQYGSPCASQFYTFAASCLRKPVCWREEVVPTHGDVVCPQFDGTSISPSERRLMDRRRAPYMDLGPLSDEKVLSHDTGVSHFCAEYRAWRCVSGVGRGHVSRADEGSR